MLLQLVQDRQDAGCKAGEVIKDHMWPILLEYCLVPETHHDDDEEVEEGEREEDG